LDSSRKKGYVLDASAFYSGVPFLSSSDHEYYTTDHVFDEIRHIKRSFSFLDALMDSGNLRILNPAENFTNAALEAAKKTGDSAKLSAADISILALAMQLEMTLISDDYAIGNVAPLLHVDVKSIGNRGATQARKWTSYCSACGRAFDSKIVECPLCGNRLKRRYRKRKQPQNNK